MTRKNDALTTRQRQSQQIMREKAVRKKREALWRKTVLYGGGVLAVGALTAGAWLWQSGAGGRAARAVADTSYGLTAKAGFALDALYLEGRNRTSMTEIEKALAVKRGDPILRLPLEELRQRLEKIESVKAAAVERALPGTLYVRIVEREPVALWQHNGTMALVDDNGVVMTGIDAAPYRRLPLIVGEGAPGRVRELMGMLGAEPDLAKRFTAAVYVGGRRWNIRLDGGVEVRLPEDKPFEAWKKLASMQSRQRLLDRNVTLIDLRLEGKMFIKVGPEALTGKDAGARET